MSGRRGAGVRTELEKVGYVPPLASLSEDEAIDLLTNSYGVSNETAWLLVGIAHGTIQGDVSEVPDEPTGEA